jgi:hypothetical protein
VGGRDFRLTLTVDTAAGLLRIAVTDARGEHLPSPPAEFGTPVDAESGRGLLLVTALADRWGVEPYPPGGKTVWAECACRMGRCAVPGGAAVRQLAVHGAERNDSGPDQTGVGGEAS